MYNPSDVYTLFSSFEQQCIHSDFVYKLFNSSNLRYKRRYFEDFCVR